MAQIYPNQLYHNTARPLDYTAQVETPEELYSTVSTDGGSIYRIIPYVGKMVHVKSQHAIYVCASVPGGPLTAVWRPAIADDGTAFFVTTPDGKVLKIGAEFIDGQGRITVTIPSPTVPIINPPA